MKHPGVRMFKCTNILMDWPFDVKAPIKFGARLAVFHNGNA